MSFTDLGCVRVDLKGKIAYAVMKYRYEEGGTMAGIESIKQKILRLDAGSFQNLCDAYLCKIGNPNIVSLGGEAGTRKTTRGTCVFFPDRGCGNRRNFKRIIWKGFSGKTFRERQEIDNHAGKNS